MKVVAGAYRATATEALEVELHVSLIDLHMEKIVARAMTRMDSRTARSAVKKAIARIQRDLRGRRGRRTKLRKTPATLKRQWLKKEFGREEMTLSQPYTAPPWINPPKIIIDLNDSIARRRHDEDRTNTMWRAYSDGSGKDNDITAAAVGTD